MAFVVINSVRAAKDDLPRIVAEVIALGLDVVREQPGFRSARLITAEDQTEASLILEWESRDHFVAYRQSPMGQQLVAKAAELHPHIAFYDVVMTLDRPGR
jgi:heme-degrading monooxygenase HmoA